jgi:hypothetical protein
MQVVILDLSKANFLGLAERTTPTPQRVPEEEETSTQTKLPRKSRTVLVGKTGWALSALETSDQG